MFSDDEDNKDNDEDNDKDNSDRAKKTIKVFAEGSSYKSEFPEKLNVENNCWSTGLVW